MSSKNKFSHPPNFHVFKKPKGKEIKLISHEINYISKKYSLRDEALVKKSTLEMA